MYIIHVQPGSYNIYVHTYNIYVCMYVSYMSETDLEHLNCQNVIEQIPASSITFFQLTQEPELLVEL